MINYVYQLIAPKIITPKLSELELSNGQVIVRPTYLSICHADQRYYRGLRDKRVLESKLPMALIHEATGVVVKDESKLYKPGQNVVLIPNVPANLSDVVAENYQTGSSFRASGIDGFMQEYVSLPADRIVACDGISPEIAAICEFISVGVHSVGRLLSKAVTPIEHVGIWGDGSLGYVIANIVKKLIPDCELTVIGQNSMKLSLFTFADNTFLDSELRKDFSISHAFECTGGQGCEPAIDDIIRYIRPEGNIMLMGVSETKVPVFTRDVLEKGLMIVGNSRSGRKDFEKAVELLQDETFQMRMKLIISDVMNVKCIEDINNAFDTDIRNPFKTVLRWLV